MPYFGFSEHALFVFEFQIFRCVCGAACGPSSAEVGEFIDDDCDVMFIDSLTLDDCDTECATGGFPACDRPADADPNEEASCYGYVEVSPGSCSMRSMEDEFWLSWLTCREGGVPIPAGAKSSFGIPPFGIHPYRRVEEETPKSTIQEKN